MLSRVGHRPLSYAESGRHARRDWPGSVGRRCDGGRTEPPERNTRMTPRTDVQQAPDGPREVRSSTKPPRPPRPAGQARPGRPNLTGDLDSMLGSEPAFRTQVRGYDRLQVDNYVTWAEAELQSARRHVEDMTTRYGSCLAELEISRR